MEDNKPKDFKSASVSHIPQDILESIKRETAIDVNGMSPMEAIRKMQGKLVPPTPTVSNAQLSQQQEQFVYLTVNGDVLKIPIEPTRAAVTMLLYVLVTVLAKDKKIAKVLKQFKDFTFQDANGAILYPKKKKK